VTVLAVDLGKTSSRVAVVAGGQVLRCLRAPGTPGLAHPAGLQAALAVTVRLARELIAELAAAPQAAAALAPRPLPPRLAGIGAAGTRTGAAAAAQLAAAVREALGMERVAVTNDVVTAHVGALGGAPGVVLVAGTGAAALAIGPRGEATIVDGAGWWLGDDGSGAWVGAEALRAVLRAADGRGPRTALSAAAGRQFGSLDAVRALAGELNPAAAAASFGPDVAAAARAGDEVAAAILRSASTALAATALAAVRAIGGRRPPAEGAAAARAASGAAPVPLAPSPGAGGGATNGLAGTAALGAAEPVPVALVGGLAEWGDVLLRPWRAALGPHVRVVDAPPHAALLGAAAVATRTDLPHEPLVHRADGGAGADEPAAARGCDIAPLYPSERHIVGRLGREAGPDRLAVDGLPTEQVRPGLEDLDTRRSAEIVELMLAAEAAVPAALVAAAPVLACAVDLAVDRMADGGRLIYVGAGTPGRLAALDAAECGPTFGMPPHRVIAVLAGGPDAATASVEGAEDDGDAGRADLVAHRVTPDDIVVGISASGRTPYVLGALAAATAVNAATVAVVNNAGSPVAAAADIAVEVLTGPEVIAGSTRLTAGTAQKIVLNVLSTATMVRLGRTFGGWMVDVRPGNDKLRRRALRIVREAAGVDADTARRALDDAAGETPTALVALLLGVDAAAARAKLAAAGGRVRAAVTP
jgi:N-acetylmuramic acid 6-phosphate etherase